MSQLYVDNIKGRTGGAVGFPTGMVVTGVSTFSNAVSIAGTLTYDDVTNVDAIGVITARSGVNVTGGALNVGSGITISTSGVNVTGVITATNVSAGSSVTAASFYGTNGVNATAGGVNVTSGGVNVTAGGVNVTAGGLKVTAGGVDVTAGGLNVTAGISTFAGDVSIGDSITHSGDNTAIRFPAADTFTLETAGSERFRIHPSGISHFKSGLAEKVNVKSQLTSANTCAITDGNVILTTTNEPGNTYPDITGVHSVLSSGEGFSVTVALKVNGSGTINGFRIDGVAQTIEWSGGSAPSAGSDGYDVFTFSAFKTGSGTTDYKVFGAATNYT